ncbi:hypothetical protein OROHE_025787 [Orobanche hederae]
MLKVFNKKLWCLCSKLGCPVRRRARPKLVVKKLGKSNSRTRADQKDSTISTAVIHPSSELVVGPRTVRFATFNAALFSMAPAVPHTDELPNTLHAETQDDGAGNNHESGGNSIGAKSTNDCPKSILKQSPLQFHPTLSAEENLTRQQKFARSRLRVSINLPDNEISLKKSGQMSFETIKGKSPLRSNSAHFSTASSSGDTRTVVEVLRELNADVLALQDVKAEEEKNMTPLSDLASALGMKYVFAESWAPEYGNAILSKWPIKRWKAHKIFDDTDFRFSWTLCLG